MTVFILAKVVFPALLPSIRHVYAGMEMSIPKFTPPPRWNCGAQPTRKAGTHSVKVTVEKGAYIWVERGTGQSQLETRLCGGRVDRG